MYTWQMRNWAQFQTAWDTIKMKPLTDIQLIGVSPRYDIDVLTGARHLMVVYQIYDSLLTHAFPWRYNFRAIILAPSVVSYK